MHQNRQERGKQNNLRVRLLNSFPVLLHLHPVRQSTPDSEAGILHFILISLSAVQQLRGLTAKGAGQKNRVTLDLIFSGGVPGFGGPFNQMPLVTVTSIGPEHFEIGCCLT